MGKSISTSAAADNSAPGVHASLNGHTTSAGKFDHHPVAAAVNATVAHRPAVVRHVTQHNPFARGPQHRR